MKVYKKKIKENTAAKILPEKSCVWLDLQANFKLNHPHFKLFSNLNIYNLEFEFYVKDTIPLHSIAIAERNTPHVVIVHCLCVLHLYKYLALQRQNRQNSYFDKILLRTDTFEKPCFS